MISALPLWLCAIVVVGLTARSTPSHADKSSGVSVCSSTEAKPHPVSTAEHVFIAKIPPDMDCLEPMNYGVCLFGGEVDSVSVAFIREEQSSSAYHCISVVGGRRQTIAYGTIHRPFRNYCWAATDILNGKVDCPEGAGIGDIYVGFNISDYEHGFFKPGLEGDSRNGGFGSRFSVFDSDDSRIRLASSLPERTESKEGCCGNKYDIGNRPIIRAAGIDGGLFCRFGRPDLLADIVKAFLFFCIFGLMALGAHVIAHDSQLGAAMILAGFGLLGCAGYAIHIGAC